MEPWIVLRELAILKFKPITQCCGTGTEICPKTVPQHYYYGTVNVGITKNLATSFNNLKFYGRITDLIYVDYGSEDLDPKVWFEKRSLVLWIRNNFSRCGSFPIRPNIINKF
jgi:hypothetical protein